MSEKFTVAREDMIVVLLQEQCALPHNHPNATENDSDCPTWCCVRRAREVLLILGAPIPSPIGPSGVPGSHMGPEGPPGAPPSS